MNFDNLVQKTIQKLNTLENSYEGIEFLVESFLDMDNDEQNSNLLEIGSFLSAATENYDLSNIQTYVNEIRNSNNISSAISSLNKILFIARNASLSFRKNKQKVLYAEWMRDGHLYEFSDKDHDRLQVLINELREEIGAYAKIDEEHRERLLDRLEKLQSELHKKVSDVDKFWGLIGDAGVALGKFGNDAKPFVDRIREMTGIVWKTQCQTEGIECNEIPLLTKSEN